MHVKIQDQCRIDRTLLFKTLLNLYLYVKIEFNKTSSFNIPMTITTYGLPSHDVFIYNPMQKLKIYILPVPKMFTCLAVQEHDEFSLPPSSGSWHHHLLCMIILYTYTSFWPNPQVVWHLSCILEKESKEYQQDLFIMGLVKFSDWELCPICATNVQNSFCSLDLHRVVSKPGYSIRVTFP